MMPTRRGPAITSRERLNRNKRRQFIIFVACLAALVVGSFLAYWSRTLALCVGLSSFAVALLVLVHGEVFGAFRCSRCGGSLVVLALHMNKNPFAIDRRIRYCPYCGVDLDAKEQATPSLETTDLLV